MATKVITNYSGSASSITVRNGHITKVTTWVPGKTGSTERVIVSATGKVTYQTAGD